MRAVGADFNFLCGIFRSREKNLAGRQKLDAMLGASSLAEAAAQMPEGSFGAQLRANPGVEGIESGYAAEIAEIAKLLTDFSPREDFSRLVFLPWDFHNLKVAVLRKLNGRGGEDLFGPEGEVSSIRLSRMAETMEFGGLPSLLFDSLQQAWIAYYETEKDSQSFEIALDRQKQLAMERISRQISPLIYEHELFVADLSIADVFFRAYFAHLSWERASWSFVGHPDLGKLKEMYHLKVEEWGGRISSLTRRTLQRLFLSVSSPGEAAEAVRRERKSHLAAMNDWGYKPPSVEYAYYFITRKLADLFNMRLVLLCALNRIPAEEARRRVIDAFV